eukprot:scpid7001/ scgid17807/ Uncharacterized protein C3orf26 homolog
MKSRPMGSADDLDDDWWMDPGPEAQSPTEKSKKKKTKAATADAAEDGADEIEASTASKKRKHDKAEEDDSADLVASVGKSKKPKKSKKSGGSPAEEKADVSSQSASKTIVSTDPIMTRAEVAEEVKTQLSSCDRCAVDEDDLTFPEEQALLAARLSDGEELTFSQYLNTAVSGWSKSLGKLKGTKHGRPVLLVITSSAVRAVDLIRAAGEFSSGCQVAKLFAKHFKLEQHKEFLTKTTVHIGVGTPNRILRLVESGHLSLKRLKYVVIDWTLKDAKQRQIYQIPEVVQDLVNLTLTSIVPRVQDGKTKIGLF